MFQGHDDVIECVWNETRNLLHKNPVEVRLSRNGGGKSNQLTNSVSRLSVVYNSRLLFVNSFKFSLKKHLYVIQG